ncbi:hypothetical protein HQ560_17380, partial [bacterium]|nr:hypothetical protein [bacterium]
MSPRHTPRWRSLLLAACLAATSGCLKVKDHLTINANGSGTVRIEVFCAAPPDTIRSSSRYASYFATVERGGHPLYPPLARGHVGKLFPGKAFTVEVKESAGENDTPTLVADVTFADVNALIASPYGKAHALSLRKVGDTLRFVAHSGFVGAVIVGDDQQSEYAIRRYIKDKGEMAADFRVTLPNTLTGSDTRTAAWPLRRADAKGDAKAEIEMFIKPLRAACSAEGVGFTPVSPPRLGLSHFEELADGPAQGMPKPPTPAQVAAAARFQPYHVKSVRAFYLPGRAPARNEHGGMHHSLERGGLNVVGVLTLPRAYRPDKWMEPTIEEARDDLGTNLLVGGDARGRSSRTTPWDSMFQNEFGKPTDDEERHILRLRVNVPPPEAKRLVVLRGFAQLDYFDNYHVVKLPKVIPAEWVQRTTAEGKQVGGLRGRNEIASPLLERLGITVQILAVEQRHAHGRTKQPLTRFWFSIRSRDAKVIATQPYDAQGRPWPKIHWAGHLSSQMDPLHFAFPVHADPPYSLAFLVSATTV